MDTHYWQARWERDQIEFHQDAVSPYLQQFLPELTLAPGACVLCSCRCAARAGT